MARLNSAVRSADTNACWPFTSIRIIHIPIPIPIPTPTPTPIPTPCPYPTHTHANSLPMPMQADVCLGTADVLSFNDYPGWCVLYDHHLIIIIQAHHGHYYTSPSWSLGWCVLHDHHHDHHNSSSSWSLLYKFIMVITIQVQHALTEVTTAGTSCQSTRSMPRGRAMRTGRRTTGHTSR